MTTHPQGGEDCPVPGTTAVGAEWALCSAPDVSWVGRRAGARSRGSSPTGYPSRPSAPVVPDPPSRRGRVGVRGSRGGWKRMFCVTFSIATSEVLPLTSPNLGFTPQEAFRPGTRRRHRRPGTSAGKELDLHL